MLLRSSISNTKKFFQKTIDGFKSLFSPGSSSSSYQKMPKNLSPYNNIPYSDIQPSFNNKDLENFYSDFTDRWDTHTTNKEKEIIKKPNNKKEIKQPPSHRPLQLPSSSSPGNQEQSDDLNGSFIKFAKSSPVKAYIRNNKIKNSKRGRRLMEHSPNYDGRDEGRSFLVAKKLKELEMMDISNVDHVLDIEEILHYYSRLTCPTYLEIVENFFMTMYAELIVSQPATPRSVNSKPRR